MKEVCEYWIDSLEAQPDGTLVTPVGLSPEQGPHEKGISFDQQWVWDLFTSTIEASEVLGVDAEFRGQLTRAAGEAAAAEDRPLGTVAGMDGRSRRSEEHAPAHLAPGGVVPRPADFAC